MALGSTVTIANGKVRQPGKKPPKNASKVGETSVTINYDRLTGSMLARMLGVANATPGNWFRSGMPRNLDTSYRLADVFQWHKSRVFGKGDPVVDDVEMVQSPALERYREERTKLARIERLRKEESVMSIADVRRGCELIAKAFREVGEFAKRNASQEMLDIINERLDEAARHAEAEFGADIDGSPIR